MGLFKDVFCTECGEKTKMLTRTHLCDDSYLCSKCAAIDIVNIGLHFILKNVRPYAASCS